LLALGAASVQTSSVAPGLQLTREVRAAPTLMNVLEVDRRRLSGRLAVALSSRGVRGRRTASSILRAERGLAAVNGGFFASRGRTSGDPVGAMMSAGRVVSEPVRGRSALLVPHDPAGAARLVRPGWRGAVRLGSRRRGLDGVERARGLVPGCGGFGGDRPTQRPDPNLLCTDRSELVMVTRRFGSRTGTPRGGVEAVVRGGVVRSVRRRANSAIPRDGYVLTGTGDAARFLARYARPGVRPAVRAQLTDGRRALDPARADLVSGGPGLLERGRIRIRNRSERAALAARGPRTLAGVRADGAIVLITVDGRQPRWSRGATLNESARLLRSFGARNGFALDGGGSTTMVVGSRVLGRPSDGSQRPVSDALVVTR
jgi:hypothetical protein